MEGLVNVYTDASYSSGKSGICFHFNEKSQNKTIVYGSTVANSSLQAELQSVIMALKYIISKYGRVNIQIRTDCSLIVNVMENKIYKKWDKKNWRKAKGKRIVTEYPNEVFLIKLMVEHIGEEYVSFIKVKSYQDLENRLAHKYATYARKVFYQQTDMYYIMEAANNCNKVENTENAVLLDFKNTELNLENIEKPWERKLPQIQQPQKKNRENFKWFSEDMRDSIVYIKSSLIVLQEDIHMKYRQINFNGMIKKVANEGLLQIPLVVRQIADNKYALVCNIKCYFIAKALNMEDIPCIITNLNNAEFVELYNNN